MSKKKRALLSSVLSLILCVSMLLGTTLAWFTTTVSNNNNRIVAGTLGVKLLKHNGTDYADISNGSGDIFTDSGENAIYWVPNMTQIVYLQVQNGGNIPLEYNVLLDVTADEDMANAFEYAIIADKKAGELTDTAWTALKTAAGTTTGKVADVVIPDGALDVNASDYFVLAVHMDENATIDLMGKAITMDVKIEASQVKEEETPVVPDVPVGPSDDTLAMVEEWEAKLAAEKEASINPDNQDAVDPYVYQERVEGTVENYLTNPTFDENMDGWSVNTAKVEWDSAGADATGGSLKLSIPGTTAVQPTTQQRVYGVPAGATIQVSFDYKFEEGATLDPTAKGNRGEKPFVSIGRFTSADTLINQANCWDNTFDASVADGEWHKYSVTLETEKETAYIDIFPRKTAGLNTMWIDNIELYIVKLPEAVTLDKNMVFFYTDMEAVTLSGTVDTATYADTSKAKVKFSVYNGSTLAWESDECSVNADGTVTAELPVSTKLTETDTPYCIMATLYYDGAAVGGDSHDIYVYDRPTAVSQDGKYVKFGDDFDAQMAYHVMYNDTENNYEEVGKAGINVVQLGWSLSAEQLLERLDLLNSYNLKGIVSLYKNNVPAGQESNVANTIEIVNAVKDHNAVFGYNFIDEPSSDVGLRFAEEDMIESYRLIRQYDTKNAIMFCECEEQFLPYTSCFADMIILDPYYEAAGAQVYKEVKEAVDNMNFEKPIFFLNSTYVHSEGWFTTPDDLRNNNYQALFAGIEGIGNYTIGDAGNHLTDAAGWEGLTKPSGEGYIPIWDVKTPTNEDAGKDAWKAMISFADVEKDIAYDFFVNEEGRELTKDLDAADGCMYYAWEAADGKAYLVALNVKGSDVTVNISVEGYTTANIITGRDSKDTYTLGQDLTLTGVEAILYQLVK